MKLNAQFAVVAIAFAGARIERGVISAGYSQVMPSHPMAKKELNTNSMTVATKAQALFVTLLVAPARMHMVALIPTAPKIINLRRPNLSMVKMAIQEAIQYSVPLQAARRRLRKGERPSEPSKIVAA